MTKYELTFEEYSYGFRPQNNIHKAVTQALKYINDGYQERLKKLVPKFRERGWVNNYRLAGIQAKLKSLDEWLRNEERIHEHL